MNRFHPCCLSLVRQSALSFQGGETLLVAGNKTAATNSIKTRLDLFKDRLLLKITSQRRRLKQIISPPLSRLSSGRGRGAVAFAFAVALLFVAAAPPTCNT